VKPARALPAVEAGVSLMQILYLDLFADYFQFYIQDDDVKYGDHLSDAWTDDAVNEMLVVSEHVIGIGTVRNMDVPETVTIADQQPGLVNEEWDRINKCSIDCDTGRLVIAGCSDYYPDAQRIELTPGRYDVTIGYSDLKNISEDGLEGEDSYHVYIVPA
jgi:hypothetical protein